MLPDQIYIAYHTAISTSFVPSGGRSWVSVRIWPASVWIVHLKIRIFKRVSIRAKILLLNPIKPFTTHKYTRSRLQVYWKKLIKSSMIVNQVSFWNQGHGKNVAPSIWKPCTSQYCTLNNIETHYRWFYTITWHHQNYCITCSIIQFLT